MPKMTLRLWLPLPLIAFATVVAVACGIDEEAAVPTAIASPDAPTPTASPLPSQTNTDDLSDEELIQLEMESRADPTYAQMQEDFLHEFVASGGDPSTLPINLPPVSRIHRR